VSGTDVGHRPGRKAGAVVALVGGEPVLYVERGGRSLLVWEHDDEVVAAAAAALVTDGPRLGLQRPVIARVNGAVPDRRIVTLLGSAGFLETPRGLRAPRG
jgi:ATP-dependent Lhr-like helicase